MNNFWYNKSIYEIMRDYLVKVLDKCVGRQFENMSHIVSYFCKNSTIKNNVEQFVADYFAEAISAIDFYKPEGYYRITDYEHTANFMLNKAALELLPHCPTAVKYDNSLHIYTQDDINALKNELNSLKFNYTFQRAVDIKGESIEDFAYRYLYYALPQLEDCTIEIDQIANILPMPPAFTVEEANAYIKRSFKEAMRLLDGVADAGYKIDYADSSQMIKFIIIQKAKELLKDNEILFKLKDVDPFFDDPIDKITMDKEFLDKLLASLHEENDRQFIEKIYSEPKDKTPPKMKDAKIYNPKKISVRVEYLN